MNIGGEDRPVKFGMNTWIEYCELRGISITKLGEDLDVISKGGGSGSEIRDLIWSSLVSGAKSKRINFDYTNYDVGDWMDDIKQTELANFFSDIGKSVDSKITPPAGKKKISAELKQA